MPRYSFVQRLLHWLIALMVIATLPIGIAFNVLTFDETLATFGKDMTNLLYKYHKTIGILILGAMVLRLIVRLALGKPRYVPKLHWFNRIASSVVHFLLYFLLLAMPVLGWLATGAGGYPIEFFDWNLPKLIAKDKELSAALYNLKGFGGWILIVLVIGHVGAALRHAFAGDGVIGRMRPY